MIKPILLALTFALALPAWNASAQATKTKPAAAAKEAVKEAVKPKAKPAAAAAATSDADKALQEGAAKEAAKLTAAQNTKLLKLLNTGDSAALQQIDGLGEAKAGNVMKKRPYAKVEDAVMVDGIGESTFSNMVSWAKGDQKETPAAKPEAKPAAKTETKPAKAETKPAKAETKPATKAESKEKAPAKPETKKKAA